jgi:REP element-mobilizing transposase RayT
MEPKILPSRRSIRLLEFDYSQPGAYFVTICTHHHGNTLGNCHDSMIQLNQIGNIIQSEWNCLKIRFPEISLDAFIVMPNHIHGIILITHESSANNKKIHPLGTVIGEYKSTTTRLINAIQKTPGKLFWQRNYYEHIIRDEDALIKVREYIQYNPINWALDKEYQPDKK